MHLLLPFAAAALAGTALVIPSHAYDLQFRQNAIRKGVCILGRSRRVFGHWPLEHL